MDVHHVKFDLKMIVFLCLIDLGERNQFPPDFEKNQGTCYKMNPKIEPILDVRTGGQAAEILSVEFVAWRARKFNAWLEERILNILLKSGLQLYFFVQSDEWFICKWEDCSLAKLD